MTEPPGDPAWTTVADQVTNALRGDELASAAARVAAAAAALPVPSARRAWAALITLALDAEREGDVPAARHLSAFAASAPSAQVAAHGPARLTLLGLRLPAPGEGAG